MKCDCNKGSNINGIQQPVLYSFVLDRPPGYKFFFELETIRYKKTNISVLNTITFYKEDVNFEEVNFNENTLTFTLQLIRIRTIK